MKLISWNVNGLRAVQRKGFLDWFKEQKADVVSLQEIKANGDKIPNELFNPLNYYSYFHPAEKPGYSGVALYTKHKPLHVKLGMDVEDIDREGRVITAEFETFFLVNAYFPNSQREGVRLPFKLFFCEKMMEHLNRLRKKGKGVVLAGDYNIAHKEIDLANPKANEGNAGFLPEEREWMTHFLSEGFEDVFRWYVKEGGHYTWWTYRMRSRERNVGWRLDYHCIDKSLNDQVVQAGHQDMVYGSDHCPVELELVVR